jgi:two-component sensor histidine kinase
MTRSSKLRVQAFSALLPVAALAAASLFLGLRWTGASVNALAVVSFMVGAALGGRWTVNILLRTSIAVALTTVAVHLAERDFSVESIALSVLVVHIAHQFGYLLGVALTPYVSAVRQSVRLSQREHTGQEAHAGPPLVPDPDDAQDAVIDGILLDSGAGRYARMESVVIAAAEYQSRSKISLTPSGELMKAIESLARAVSVDAIQEIIRTSARQLIGSEGVALVLAEDDLCHYVEEDAVGPLWKGKKFKMTECISGWSMMNRQTAVISDISTDKRIPYHLYATTFVKSLVMTPVGTDRPIGALGAYWASVYEPTDYEIETVKTLARMTATALENANLVSMLSTSLTNAELRQAELQHRAESAYLVAHSLAHVSLTPKAAATFAARLETLARAHEALDERLARQRVIDIRELVQSQLEAFGPDAPGHIRCSGPSLLLDRAHAVAVGIAVNELAVHRLKGGQRTNPTPNLGWRIDHDCLFLEWREKQKPGAHPDAADEKSGLQHLRRLIEGQAGGEVRHIQKQGHAIVEIRLPLHEMSARPVFTASGKALVSH